MNSLCSQASHGLGLFRPDRVSDYVEGGIVWFADRRRLLGLLPALILNAPTRTSMIPSSVFVIS
jgi:hypothetical protein